MLCHQLSIPEAKVPEERKEHNTDLISARVRTAVVGCQSTRHTVISSQVMQHGTKLWVGAQNSVGMQILRVTTKVQNLAAPDPKGR